ncbi:MAG TPA: Mut7-C RNAse domain-containing protein, partial [Chloroflexota bacterium]|nr:Mut7-C RNAse domain-containing protein [Chloroflexota bacterium]
VPHTEVDLLLVNGESMDFAYQVQQGDRISVYPPFRTLDVSSVSHVRPPALDEMRFVLDAHLGTLASHLRMLGFDTLYRNDYDDSTLATISAGERRILLTRDRGLLKRRQVEYGYHVWATDPDQQVVEVLRRYRLFDAVAPFRRCMRCNALLERVEKAAVEHLLEPKTRLYYDEFARCAACDRVYWKGSHFEKMQRLVARWLAAPAAVPASSISPPWQ